MNWSKYEYYIFQFQFKISIRNENSIIFVSIYKIVVQDDYVQQVECQKQNIIFDGPNDKNSISLTNVVISLYIWWYSCMHHDI